MHDNSTATRLLEPHELAELGPSVAQGLPLDVIDPNPLNPRGALTEIEALADNIRQFSTLEQSGLMQPILVRRTGERYELLGGHRRLAAFKVLREREPHDPRWRVIDAIVWTTDDEQSYLALISTQAHIVNWRPKEQATALERLAAAGLTLTQIGQRLNRSEVWASKRLRTYSDSVLSGFVQSGRLGNAVAEEFLVVLDVKIRQELAERAVAERWTQDKARGEVRALRVDRQLREIGRRARELLQLLGTVDPSRVPIEAAVDLNLLSLRIRRMAKGDKPVLPTIEQAQQAAKINPNARQRGRTNSSPKRRTMPRPA